MNKAIEKLAVEAAATTTWKPGLGNENVAAYMQKFAEMIVKEYIYPYMTAYNMTVEANLENAEQVVECVELRIAEAERKRKVRSDALAKLSREEREVLGLA